MIWVSLDSENPFVTDYIMLQKFGNEVPSLVLNEGIKFLLYGSAPFKVFVGYGEASGFELEKRWCGMGVGKVGLASSRG